MQTHQTKLWTTWVLDNKCVWKTFVQDYDNALVCVVDYWKLKARFSPVKSIKQEKVRKEISRNWGSKRKINDRMEGTGNQGTKKGRDVKTKYGRNSILGISSIKK